MDIRLAVDGKDNTHVDSFVDLGESQCQGGDNRESAEHKCMCLCAFVCTCVPTYIYCGVCDSALHNYKSKEGG